MKRAAALLGCLLAFSFSMPTSEARRAGFRMKPVDTTTTTMALQPNQVRFFLPRNLLDITITYDVYQQSKTGQTIPPEGSTDANTRTVLLPEVPLKLNLVSVPDPVFGFIADYNHIQGLVTDAKATDLTLTENGCISQYSGEYVDEIGPIVGEVAAGLIKIGKKIPTFAALSTPPGTPQFTKLKNPIVVEMTIDLDDLKPLATSTLTDHIWTVIPTKLRSGIFYDLADFTTAASQIATSNGFQDVKVAETRLFFKQAPDKSSAETVTAALFSVKPDKNGWYQALVARDPQMCEFFFASDHALNVGGTLYQDCGVELLDQYAQFAQSGGLCAHVIRAHTLTDAGTKLQFNAAGGVKEINVTRLSTLKSIADVFKTITDAL